MDLRQDQPDMVVNSFTVSVVLPVQLSTPVLLPEKFISLMPAAGSPFRDVPYDILREIFLQCLPEDRLDQPQPSTEIAPLLLCHVCASWRAVALANALLWTHLHIRLPVLWNEHMNPIVRDSVALERDIEFMKWWRTNHRPLAPFLRINVYRRSWRESSLDVEEVNLGSEVADFLSDYMSSAQYLDVGSFYTYLIGQGVEKGWGVVSSNLQILVAHAVRFADVDDSDDEDEHSDADLEPPSQIPPTLRRLSLRLHYKMMEDRDFHHWSQLTHLSLSSFECINLGIWFSILSALKNLQWGNFDLNIWNDNMSHPPPLKISLPSLSALYISCWIRESDEPEYPLTTLFQNVKLPAVRTLSLLSWMGSWRDSGGNIEIRNMLKSAPGVTKLIIGFLGFTPGGLAIPTAIDRDIQPLLRDAPFLSHLQIEWQCDLSSSDAILLATGFVKRLLSKCWLDLTSPGNTIKTVTVVIKKSGSDVDLEFERILKAMVICAFNKHDKDEMNDILFKVVLEAEQVVYSPHVAWKTWASNV